MSYIFNILILRFKKSLLTLVKKENTSLSYCKCKYLISKDIGFLLYIMAGGETGETKAGLSGRRVLRPTWEWRGRRAQLLSDADAEAYSSTPAF